MVRQAIVICVMAPPIHLGARSMALMLWLPFELLLFTPRAFQFSATKGFSIQCSCMYVCIMHIALNKNVLSHGNSDDN